MKYYNVNVVNKYFKFLKILVIWFKYSIVCVLRDNSVVCSCIKIMVIVLNFIFSRLCFNF